MRRSDDTSRRARSGSLGDAIRRLHERERSAWRLVVVATFLALPLVLAAQWVVSSLASAMDTTLDAAALVVAVGLVVTAFAVVLARFLSTLVPRG